MTGETELFDFQGLPGVRALSRSRRRPAVLLIHGVFGSHRDFDKYVGYLAAHGYDAYAFSRRGRLGVPPTSATGVTLADYINDTYQAIGVIGGDVIVAGHSLGGLIAQKVAEAGRCKAAILLGSAPPR